MRQYELGDRVELLADIWDDGDDGHHPPGYIGRKGETLNVRSVGRNRIGINHDGRKDDEYFLVWRSEIRPAKKGPTILAWYTQIMGVRSVVFAKSRGTAAMVTMEWAKTAGYPVRFTDVRVTRARVWDGCNNFGRAEE